MVGRGQYTPIMGVPNFS